MIRNSTTLSWWRSSSTWKIVWFIALWGTTTLMNSTHYHPPHARSYSNFFMVQAAEDGAAEEDDGEEDGGKVDFYFYRNDPEGSLYINDLEIPDNRTTVEKPDFLYAPTKEQGVRIVEYYAHWCPHCQHLRPHFIEFAQRINEVAEPHGVHVSVYAISCVPHKALCQDQGIAGYPRVYLYLEGSINSTAITPWELHPFKVLRMVGVADETALGDEQPMLQQKLQQQHPDSKLPHDNNNNNKVGGGSNSQRIRLSSSHKKDEESDNNAPPPFFLPRTKQDIFNDAYLSFEFALRNGIYAGVADGLSNTTAPVLLEWIMLLQATLPPMWKIQDMITELLEHKEDIVLGEEQLMAIVDRHPPPKKSFSRSCTRGDKFAGYTCGLWELFHIMTIGLVEWNHLAMGDDWAYFVPDQTAKALRDYIENFFGCEECRVNFLHEYDSCALDLCNRLAEDATGGVEDWKELSMWLFEMHNAVNTRLLRERMDRDEKRSPTDQEVVNVQWPSRWDCPTCWHADGRWDQDQIYMFLRLTYWPEDQTSAEMRRQLAARQLQILEAGESEEFDRLPPWVLPMIPVVFLILGLLSWYRRRLFVKQSGRHKKTDE